MNLCAIDADLHFNEELDCGRNRLFGPLVLLTPAETILVKMPPRSTARPQPLAKRGMVTPLPLDLRLAARIYEAVERDLRQNVAGTE